jgi:hypothetical protein
MSRLRNLRDRWADPLLTALTILLALIIFFIAPLQAAGLAEAEDIGILVFTVIVAALVFLSGNPVATFFVVVGFVVTAAAAVLRLHQPSSLDLYLKASSWILMSLALIWVVAGAVFASGKITYHRVMGAILLYLAIGWTFAGLFLLVGLLFPNAFDGMAISDGPALTSLMAYYSFGSLTTAGSGDIAAVHPLARSLTNLEAMVGQLYPATLLARLVTLEIEDEAKH